jgi:hypothetical protein
LTFNSELIIFDSNMSEEIKKDRSRNYPRMSLADALELAKRLYAKAGKAKISPVVAVGALGYNGLNGAALGTLGGISQYGLIDRERGKSVSISPLAIKLIHPLNSDQEIASKRESVLLPQVFKELFDGGFHKCDEDLIVNHLVQNDFTPEGAKKAASVFKENVSIAKLQEDSIIEAGESEQKEHIGSGISLTSVNVVPHPENETPIELNKIKKVLATYSIPLGANEATITFTGEELSAEDFTALGEYVTLFKAQFERKQKTESSNPIPPKPTFTELPFVAQRKSLSGETMVKIIGQPWFENGKWICQAEGGVLVPVDEILPNVQK